ncbi:MAG: msmF 9 [Microbacteriaceae bacterium]|jgi:raffinose/stachyose/melibiose transport system permease protein|nr:msmF 9 [Microbacteriaceae bacterium]
MTADSTIRPRRRRLRNTTKLLFIAPAAIVFAVVILLPIVENLFYSFTDWTGFGSEFAFVGLQNFARLFGDQQTLQAFWNTILFTVCNAPLQIGLGLLLAVTLKKPGRFISVLRTIIVLPIAISGVVLGFLGTVIFDPNSGILRAMSEAPGLGFLAQNWLGNSNLAMASVIAMNLWQWSGFTMLIFLAGLSTIPAELYEAARLDGAGAWGQFRNITWPLLAPAATINIVLTLIGGFKVFDIIYVLTQGGPGTATESIVMRVTSEGGFARFGYASAIDFALTAVILVVALVSVVLLRRREIDA